MIGLYIFLGGWVLYFMGGSANNLGLALVGLFAIPVGLGMAVISLLVGGT